jgi:hypothetical protein
MNDLAALRDVLLPATDAGVLLQLSIVMAAGPGALWAVRRDADLRLFVAGMWIMVIAAMGLRALH